ncbi:MAG: PQQ-binding-like beta-propeller repeat protein [Chloroflexota bacterium]|nr:PQQ-binding-like beta-propeller repeat protein [Chloroflexota bacterium]
MRTVFTTLVVAIAVIGSIGAGSASPQALEDNEPIAPLARGNSARTAEMPGPGPTQTPAEQWHFAPQAEGSPLLALVLADGFLYTIDARSVNNALYAVDRITGDERWRYPSAPSEVIVGTPAVADGIVLVPVRNLEDKTYLASLEAETGEERWRVPLAPELVGASSPAIVDGIAYVGTSDRHVTALAVADGGVRWRVSVGARVEADLAVAGGVVYVATDEPSVVALNATDGSERWRVGFEDDEILLTPVVADELVFVIAYPHPTVIPEGRLHALEVGSGAERWRSNGDYGLSFEPAVTAGVVYVTAEIPQTRERALVALDAEAGRERWRLAEGLFLISPPSVAEETVYVGSANGLLAVDAGTGKLGWEVPVIAVTSVPVVVDGAVYVAGPDGLVAVADATAGP